MPWKWTYLFQARYVLFVCLFFVVFVVVVVVVVVVVIRKTRPVNIPVPAVSEMW